MPPAAQAASSTVYGDAFLRAIDWALIPDEKLRPRQVADFRRACREASATADALPRPATTKPASPILAVNQECDVVGVMLFADVLPLDEGAGETAVGEHREARGRLATLVSQTVSAVPANTRLAANTKEGCAVCYVGDPEDALRTATQVVAAAGERGLALQVGINLGPVRVQPGTSGRSRIFGDGIAFPFRVMRFAEPGEVLVSSVYRDLVGQLRSTAVASFAYERRRLDPQAREQQLYHHVGEAPPERPQTPSEGWPLAVAGDIGPAAVAAAERRLSQHIGPLARILVARTLPRANGHDEFHQLLAALPPDASARAAFVAGVSVIAHSSSAPADQASRRSASAAVVTSRVETAIEPTAATTRLPSDPVTPGALGDADPGRVGQLLTRQIGPLTKVLLRREAAHATALESLCRAPATQIDKEEDRKRLLSDAGVAERRRTRRPASAGTT
ncbi:hypothetical protein [Accumulibacter sp.]|uniref:hypothetical protein n=1 Tax=Accumulibacter sp. TaxID=2053492 RepID=UPI0025EB5635|nr:hypothetical protein [Accumulibacter sp.]MCM8596029.1 hypothetical protein [Accumulibacter sp.]MDS4050178.1 hypothetical protein [Accumulibacter sp.]